MFDDILVTNNLTKIYNGIPVVNEVNMHIKKGDIYGFVGENGAGKTTIMRMVAGLSIPDGGSFTLFGVPFDDHKINKAKNKLAGIVESVSLTKNLDALDNLKLQCMLTGVKKSDEELLALLMDVGLEVSAIRGKKVGNFSLGMRQRLGLAMVMINDPEFILLDEPMNGLDPKGFIDVRNAILNLNQKGVTFLISSHILSELDKVANKVGFISHGKFIEEISIDELHQKARKKIEIKTKQLDDLLICLKEKAITNIQVIGDIVIIYDFVDINQLLKILVNENIEIEMISLLEDTIETYYLNLINRSEA